MSSFESDFNLLEVTFVHVVSWNCPSIQARTKSILNSQSDFDEYFFDNIFKSVGAALHKQCICSPYIQISQLLKNDKMRIYTNI